MDLEKIQQLMKTLEESKLKKIVVKQGDFELTLEKEGEASFSSMPVMASSHPHMVRGFVEDPSIEASQRGERGGSSRKEVDGTYVSSPMVGTFYASSGPEQSPFVKVGDKVEESTVVCIIEAMKVMNEVKAGKSGRIAEILVNNGQPIEFGSKLFRVV
jgi:acetyl-CoA carboxylase biotin carboxyl carrier protein